MFLILVFRRSRLGWQALACDPITALLAVALGVGEMGLSSLLGYAAIVIVDAAVRRHTPVLLGRRGSQSPTGWSAAARGGWMQYYIKAVDILPLPVGLALVLLYVFFEECIFRGVVLAALLPLGDCAAIALSAVLFMAVQIPHTPGWRTAMFPVIGALVVGVVHGSLFVAVPRLTPLALAHALCSSRVRHVAGCGGSTRRRDWHCWVNGTAAMRCCCRNMAAGVRSGIC